MTAFFSLQHGKPLGHRCRAYKLFGMRAQLLSAGRGPRAIKTTYSEAGN
jgi:hypothetical protein